MAKVITILSAKGGSGKTSLAMFIASAASKLGLKTLLLDGDRNPQLMEWQAKMETYDWDSTPPPIWPENIAFEKLQSSIEAVSEQLNSNENYDIIIIDTRPGTYEDTSDIAFMSDQVLIPATIHPAELDWALETYSWINKCKASYPKEEEYPDISLVYLKASPTVLKAFESNDTDQLTEIEYQQILKVVGVPFIQPAIPYSKLIENMPIFGPLNAQFDAFPSRRRLLGNLLNKGESLISTILKGKNNG